MLPRPTSLLPSLQPAGDGVHDLVLPEGGASWDGIHGGVVIGVLIGAAAGVTGAAPVAVTAHLHRAARPGSASVQTVIRHAGRAFSSVRAELIQDGLKASASVLLSGAPPSGVLEWRPRALLWEPPPETIDRLDLFDSVMPVARELDIRPLGGTRPLAGGSDPTLRAWIRLREPTSYTPALAAVLLDALAPSLYAVRDSPVAIPTVEFTAHLIPRRPSGSWFLIRQTTIWSDAFTCLDEAHLHDEDGSLLATARQQRRIVGNRDGHQ